ncbi:MAG: HigA family addiction module antitoxin [Gemmatimonadota bacterium]|nr:HigA family addiction module antitoxin [Gemmatimonadota bacterium]
MTDSPRPIHPGRILLEDVLKPLGITQRVAAERLGFSYPRLNEIVNGKRRVTPETALRIARFSGTEPGYWLDLQQAVDLWDAAGAIDDADFAAGRARRYGVARVVPLGEEPDDDLEAGTTAAARLAMVEELTRQSWELSHPATPKRRGDVEDPEAGEGT